MKKEAQRSKTDRAAQDSLFSAVDRFAAAFPQTDVAKKALISKGRRAWSNTMLAPVCRATHT